MKTETRYKYPSMQIPDSAFELIDYTSIWWLGGGGFLINARGTIILLDPVISTSLEDEYICETGEKLAVQYPLTPEHVKRADLILYTHADGDHVGRITSKKLSDQLHTYTLCPAPVFEKLVREGIDPKELLVCRADDIFKLHDISISAIDADHPHAVLSNLWGIESPPRPYRTGDCLGYILSAPDGKFVFPGDTRLMEQHLKLQDVNVVALDVSRCPFHLGTLSAAALANALDGALLFPYHYHTFESEKIPAYQGEPEEMLAWVKTPARGRVYEPGRPLCLKEKVEISFKG